MKFGRILGVFEKKPLTVHPGLCVVNRHKKSECRACVNACPRGLIRIGEHGLSGEADFSRCEGCGLCAAVCPNGVFEVKRPSDEEIVAKMGTVLSHKADLTIGCRAARKGKPGGCDLVLTCLGRLNEAMLVAASTLGAREIVLARGACEACGAPMVPAVIERLAENCRRLIAAFGKEVKFSLPGNDPAGARDPVIGDGETAEPAQGRREFLTFLKGKAISTASAVAEVAVEDFKDRVSPRRSEDKPAGLEHRVPDKHRRLVSQLRKLGDPKQKRMDRAGLPLARIRIDGSCSLCGRCSQFCPTGSLAVVKHVGMTGLDFLPGICTGCGLCELTCSEGALSLEDSVDLEELVSLEPVSLVTRKAYTCAICGQEFGSPEPKDYCRYCERKRKLRNAPW